MFRPFTAVCAILCASSISVVATPELEERVAMLEQQLIQAQAESVAFGRRNIELVEENAYLKNCTVNEDTRARFAQALANVVDHSADMREQLGASQQRIENLAEELQEAMQLHNETQLQLEAKHRSLFAHATTLKQELESIEIQVEEESYFEEGWDGEEQAELAQATAESFPVPGAEVTIAATDEEFAAEDEFNFDNEPTAEEVEPATTEAERFFDATAPFEDEVEATTEEEISVEEETVEEPFEIEDAPYIEEEVEATFEDAVESSEPAFEQGSVIETEPSTEVGIEPLLEEESDFFGVDSIFEAQPEFEVEAPVDPEPFFNVEPPYDAELFFEIAPSFTEPLVIEIEILEQV